MTPEEEMQRDAFIYDVEALCHKYKMRLVPATEYGDEAIAIEAKDHVDGAFEIVGTRYQFG